MAVLMDLIFIFLVKSTFFALVTVRGASKSFSCEIGFFYDTTKGQCEKCSECPANHIIHIPCSGLNDQKCRPYTFKNLGHESKAETKTGKKATPVNSELTTVESNDKCWKTLAFALIGLLSVLIIATFIVLVFVYRKLRRSIVIKQSEEGDLMDDADSGYVVIRAIHHLATPRPDNPLLNQYPRGQQMGTDPPLLQPSGPPSIDSGRPADSVSTCTQLPGKGKLCLYSNVYQPQRRMLNYDADDVFESDDNASVNHFTDPKENLQTLIDEDKT